MDTRLLHRNSDRNRDQYRARRITSRVYRPRRARRCDRLVRSPATTSRPRQVASCPIRLLSVSPIRRGKRIANRPVSWVVGTGGGSVGSPNTTTDGSGKASTKWTLGPAKGKQYGKCGRVGGRCGGVQCDCYQLWWWWRWRRGEVRTIPRARAARQSAPHPAPC